MGFGTNTMIWAGRTAQETVHKLPSQYMEEGVQTVRCWEKVDSDPSDPCLYRQFSCLQCNLNTKMMKLQYADSAHPDRIHDLFLTPGTGVLTTRASLVEVQDLAVNQPLQAAHGIDANFIVHGVSAAPDGAAFTLHTEPNDLVLLDLMHLVIRI